MKVKELKKIKEIKVMKNIFKILAKILAFC